VFLFLEEMAWLCGRFFNVDTGLPFAFEVKRTQP